MEIKVIIGLDERTTKLLGDLTSAILATKSVASIPAPKVEKPAEEKEAPKAEAPKGKKGSKKAVEKEETKDEGIGEETTVDDIEKDDEAEETEYTVDDVRTVMADAKRSGKPSADLKKILKQNGAGVVSDLDPSKYAKVIAAVKAL
jgi:hypothetical protein